LLVEDMEKRLEKVSTSIDPAITKEIDVVKREIANLSTLMNVSIRNAEKEIRNDFRDIVADASEAFDKSTEVKAAELSATMANNLETTREEIAGVREAGRVALQEAIADFFEKVKEVRATLDLKSQQLEADIGEGEKRLRASAEQNAKNFAERSERFEEALSSLTLDSQKVRTEYREIEEQLRKDMQKDLQDASTSLTVLAEDVGHRCRVHTNEKASETGQQLQKEMDSGLKDITNLLDKLSEKTNAMITEEKDSRRTTLAEMEQRRVRELHDRSIEIEAALASASADASVRSDGTNRRVDSLNDRLGKLVQGLEVQDETSKDTIKRLNDDISLCRDNLQMAHRELKRSFEDECRKSAEALRSEAAHLDQEIAMTRAAANQGIGEIRSELPSFALR
jgi:hypothetical protein